MTPSTHVKVVKSYDATCIISNRTRATYWILENAAKIIQGFHMGHSFFGELEVHQRILKIPKKCIQSPLLLLCTVKALHIKYFQERLGKLSILWSQIIMGKVRKQTSKNVPLRLLSVDLPTYGKPTNPYRESPLLVTSNPSPAPPPLEDGGAKNFPPQLCQFSLHKNKLKV